jgi:biotin operon repressor
LLDPRISESAKARILAEWRKTSRGGRALTDRSFYAILRSLVPLGVSSSLISRATGRRIYDVLECTLHLVEDGVIARPPWKFGKRISQRRFIESLRQSATLEEVARVTGMLQSAIQYRRLALKKQGVRGLRYFRSWHSDEDVLRVISRSASLGEAARALRMSRSGVYDRVNRMEARGITKYPWKRLVRHTPEVILETLNRDPTRVEAARRLGVSDSALARRLRELKEKGYDIPPSRQHPTYPEVPADILLKALRQYGTRAETGRRLGLSPCALYKRIGKLKAQGYTVPPPTGRRRTSARPRRASKTKTAPL